MQYKLKDQLTDKDIITKSSSSSDKIHLGTATYQYTLQTHSDTHVMSQLRNFVCNKKLPTTKHMLFKSHYAETLFSGV